MATAPPRRHVLPLASGAALSAWSASLIHYTFQLPLQVQVSIRSRLRCCLTDVGTSGKGSNSGLVKGAVVDAYSILGTYTAGALPRSLPARYLTKSPHGVACGRESKTWTCSPKWRRQAASEASSNLRPHSRLECDRLSARCPSQSLSRSMPCKSIPN
ncbi:hypothetical protein EJ04DRAFT_117438 [Polyplosphaeria fusca]|uniref:Uncharacterized protein n=1 Tax=Polyplosphaeria fusca TaxID=682080 RepID=A0A9P4V926_9PLEO|nr:hypothetical protein EJ04DRAFT_117438 [Polyplosphaeria fusca]